MVRIFDLCWKPVFAHWKDPHLRSDDRYGLTTAYWVFFTIFFIATMLVLAVSIFNNIANILSSFIRRFDIKSEWMPPIIPFSGADLHPGGSSLWSQDPLECWFSLWQLFCWQLRWEKCSSGLLFKREVEAAFAKNNNKEEQDEQSTSLGRFSQVFCPEFSW